MPTVVRRKNISIWQAADLGYKIVPLETTVSNSIVPEDSIFPFPHRRYWYSISPKPMIIEFEGALLLPDGSVLTNEHYVFQGLTFTAPDDEGWKRFATHIESLTGDIVEVRCPDNVDELESPCFQLNTGHRRNFAHFQHDVIARIFFLSFCQATEGQNLKILTSFSAFPIQDYVLNHIFGLDRVVFQHNNSVRARRSFVSCLPMDTRGVIIDAFNYAHDLQKNILPVPSERNRRIFVSRKDGAKSSGREIFNDGQLTECVLRHGFEFLEISKMSPEEIVSAFSGASVIVGVHGAGLMNFMFSSKSTTVIELASIGSTHPFIAKIGGLMGYRYIVLPLKIADGHTIVDIHQLESALLSAIN